MNNLPSRKKETPPKKKRRVRYESDTDSSEDSTNPSSYFVNQAKGNWKNNNNKKLKVDTDGESVNSNNSTENAYMLFSLKN